MGVIARVGDTTVGLTTIARLNGAHQTGLTITVKIANADVADSFLDFNDNTFKTSGWTTKSQNMTEDTNEEVYKFVFDSSSAITTEFRAVALYETTISSTAVADSEDVFFQDFSEQADVPTAAAIADAVLEEDVTAHSSVANSLAQFLRRLFQLNNNKLELADGSSSNWVLFDDDDSSTLSTSDITDKNGSAITQSSAIPSRRTRFF